MMRKLSRTAAVALKIKDDNISYANILRKACEKVSLSRELGIDNSKIRRGINGGLIIEIPGTECQSRADAPASKLVEVLKGEAKVSRPQVMAEVKISGLDDSVSKEEVQYVIAEKGGCLSDNVKISEFRWRLNGLDTIWVKCPLFAANKIMKTPRLRIRWTVVRVELLERKPLQCYNCWDYGHVSFHCPAAKQIRKDVCYNCGHKAQECTNKSLVCKERDLATGVAEHLGSPGLRNDRTNTWNIRGNPDERNRG